MSNGIFGNVGGGSSTALHRISLAGVRDECAANCQWIGMSGKTTEYLTCLNNCELLPQGGGPSKPNVAKTPGTDETDQWGDTGKEIVSQEDKDILAEQTSCESCSAGCQQIVDANGGDVNECIRASCAQYCGTGAGPATTALPFAGKKCNSAEVIKAVQKAIGTTADGKWGPRSQAVLATTGKSFPDFAPGCEGTAPDGKKAATTGGGGAKPATPVKPVTASLDMSSLMQNPLVWVGVAAAAVVGVVMFSKRSK